MSSFSYGTWTWEEQSQKEGANKKPKTYAEK